jgi:hypothetical protein
MVDRIRELREALKRWDGNDYMPESQMRLIVDTAREHLALRESLQDGSLTEALRLADELGIRENGHNLNAPTLRRLMRVALTVEGDAE